MSESKNTYNAPPSMLRVCFIASVGIYVSVKVIVWWLAVLAEGKIPATTTGWQWFWVVGDHVILIVFPFVFIPMLRQRARGTSAELGGTADRGGK